MTFRIEGDYIIYDYRKIARLLPNLSLATLRAAESALQDAYVPGEEPEEPEAPVKLAVDNTTPLEKLRALSAISGGLLSMSEIEDALS
jgi:hypothetical protein